MKTKVVGMLAEDVPLNGNIGRNWVIPFKKWQILHMLYTCNGKNITLALRPVAWSLCQVSYLYDFLFFSMWFTNWDALIFLLQQLPSDSVLTMRSFLYAFKVVFLCSLLFNLFGDVVIKHELCLTHWHNGSLYLSLKPKFKTLVWNQISVWNQN